LTGLNYNPVFQEWKKTKDTSVNYIISAKKN
jgi:2-polyprenyl-3-methyl-5-hydroxy-6-metoxy-1,4-benzoquinol methylase